MKPVFYFFLVLTFDSLCSFAQPRKELRSDNDGMRAELRYLDTVVNGLTKASKEYKDSLLSCRALNIGFSRQLDSVKQSSDVLAKFIENHLSLSFVNVFNQQWASSYLSAEHIKRYVKGIYESKSDSEWEEAYSKNQPSYCFHQLDSSKVHGVLLNLPAIRALQDTLAKSTIGWKIPDSKDISLLKSNLELCKDRLTELITSSNSTFPYWSKKGADIFGWNFVPLAYRRSVGAKWFGKTFASFLYLDVSDLTLKDQFGLFEMYEDTPNTIFLSKVDRLSNYGIFIRLIKK